MRKTYANYFLVLLAVVLVILIGYVDVPPDKIFTPSEVLNKKEILLNREITVQGIAAMGAGMCTLEWCPGENCNSCFTEVLLQDKENRNKISIRGSLGSVAEWWGKEYRIRGVWKKEVYEKLNDEEFYLELTSFELVSEQSYILG